MKLNKDDYQPFMERKLYCNILQAMGPKKFHKPKQVDYSEEINMTDPKAEEFFTAIKLTLRELKQSGNCP